MHSEAFDAFHTINGEDEGKIIQGKVCFNFPLGEPPAGDFSINTKMEEKILTIKLFPGADPDIISYASEKKIKGIVIEGYGAGGIPYRGSDFIAMTEKAVKNNILTVWLVQKEPLSSRHSALTLTISALKGVQIYQSLLPFRLQELFCSHPRAILTGY